MHLQHVEHMTRLMCQEPPSYTPATLTVLSQTEAYEAFERLTESRIQFNYTQGNCHDRAHMMSLLLAQRHIICAKIWAFAPGNYCLINRSLFTIKDKNGMSPDGIITWGYHVAPVVKVQQKKGVRLCVIDPSLFPGGPVPYRKWLDIFNSNSGMYLFLNHNYYLFNTLDGNTVYAPGTNDPETALPSQKLEMPTWFPKLVTGDFYDYDGDAAADNMMPRGLAANETAYRFYKEQIAILPASEADTRYELNAIAGVADDFQLFLQNGQFGNTYYQMLQEKYSHLINQYRVCYENEIEYWVNYIHDHQIL